jgi:hypothetical protein
MTREEYEKLCEPIIEIIADLRRRHEDELRPWFERLNAITATYTPVISVPRAQWEELQMRQGIRSGSQSDGSGDANG